MNHRNALAYQMAAAEGATHIGLLVLVYDAIARDLIEAGNAVRQSSIQRRCAASAHALLLLAHVESWADLVEDPGLAASLRQFYSMLRARILQIGAAPAAAAFEALAQLVCDTRTAWQTKEQSMLTAVRSAPPRGFAQPADERTARLPVSFRA